MYLDHKLSIQSVDRSKDSITKLKIPKTSGDITFTDPQRTIKHLKKIMKKQAGEIAHDISKLELGQKQSEDDLKSTNQALRILTERINRIENGSHSHGR